MAEAGRNTILTDELFRKIKESILNGNDLRKTAKVCEINEGTLYVWHSDNYLDIAFKIEGWRRDRKLMLAEKNIEEMLQMNTENVRVTDDGDFTFKDTGLVRIKADMSKFVAETLGKDNGYSKRSELTGKNGEQLVPLAGFNYVKPDNTNDQTTSETRQGLDDSVGQDN